MRRWIGGFLVGAILAWSGPAVAEYYNQGGEGGESTSESGASAVAEGDREEHNIYRGGFSSFVPEGNEGPSIVTPWGGASVNKPARIYKLVAYGDFIKEGSPEHKWFMEEMKAEVGESCRWLGLGPKQWKFPFLLGLDCWPDLRVWED